MIPMVYLSKYELLINSEIRLHSLRSETTNDLASLT